MDRTRKGTRRWLILLAFLLSAGCSEKPPPAQPGTDVLVPANPDMPPFSGNAVLPQPETQP